MKKKPIIQSLWIGTKLSVMENLSISSFLQNGHPFHLYIYDNVQGVPEGVTLKDANNILHSDKIFKYKDFDSYAGFSNIFRYKLLLEKGNYWVDTDIICLKPFLDNTEYVFASQKMPNISFKHKGKSSILYRSQNLVTEVKKFVKNPFYFKEKKTATTCIIKAPSASAIMEYCYNKSANKDPQKLYWGQTGPQLLTKAINKFDMWDYVAEPGIFCPIDHWNWKQIISESFDEDVLTNSQAVHLWNEFWRRDNVDKSSNFSENCIYEQLKKRYLNK